MKFKDNLFDEDTIDKIDELPRSETSLNDYSSKRNLYHNPHDHNHINRFLLSRVGQPWSAVVSEFVTLDWLLVKDRTLSKLREYVETETFIKNKEVWYNDNSSFQGSPERRVKDPWRDNGCFYVHPVSKTLEHVKKGRKVDYQKRHADKVAKTLRYLAPYQLLEKIDGVWYYVTIRYLNDYCGAEPMKTAELWKLLKKVIRPDESLWYSRYRRGCYICLLPGALLSYRFNLFKEQLNKKELQKYKLSNG